MSTMASTAYKRIFAVIIGINEYEGRNRLRGAVADADDVNNMLVQIFGAHPNDIINLRDCADKKDNNTGPATRENIISTIQSLKNRADIIKGDAIVIYFAGHGSRVLSTDSKWPEQAVNYGRFIESICPVDIGRETADSKEICGIPDFTLRILLNELSREKGNNITLILDSCHSGGANRYGEDSKDYQSRQYSNPPPIPQDCDSAIINFWSRGAEQASGFQGQDLDSHVAIVACSSEQLAGEREYSDCKGYRGIFTRALTAVLKDKKFPRMTYSLLIHHISAKFKSEPRKPNQTPQLSGNNRNRLLFHDQVHYTDKSFILGYKVNENEFFLEAGTIHGLTAGSELQIFNQPHESDNPLGTLRVTEIHRFTSTLIFPQSEKFVIGEVFFAKAAFLPLKIYTDRSFRDGVTQILSHLSGPQRSTVQWSNSPKEADVKLEISDDQLLFYRCSRLDQDVIDIIGARILHTVSITDYKQIFGIFQCIANYNRHLQTKDRDAGPSSIELYEVKYHMEGFNRVFSKEGNNLISGDTVEIAVDANVDNAKLYAVTINNPGNIKDLYPYLFIFDSGDFSIDPWYMPDTSGVGLHAEAPLKKVSKLDICYGSEGRTPYKFVLSSEFKEVSFIKLYLSTSPIALDVIQQDSPFDPSKNDNRKGVRFEPPLEFWATRVIKLIQTPTSTNNSESKHDNP